MTITWQYVLAALIGGGFTILGVWSAAVADRIRYRKLERRAEERQAAPAPRRARRQTARRPAPASPRAKTAPEDDVQAWLESMGVTPELAARAAARARAGTPTAPFEALVRAALTYTETEN